MSESSDKGKKLEMDIAALIRKKHLGKAKRNPGSGNKWYRAYDVFVDGLPIHLESKAQEQVQIHAWYEQASNAASPNETAIVAFRTEKHPEILSTLKLSELLDLIAEIAQLRAEIEELRRPSSNMTWNGKPVDGIETITPEVEVKEPLIVDTMVLCRNYHVANEHGQCLQVDCVYSQGYKKPKTKK